MTVNVSDWSETPDTNATVNGINVAEGCPPGNINGGIRAIMAGVKTLSLTIPASASFMPIGGGAFTGNVTRQGFGAYRFNSDSGLTSGKTDFLPDGSALPTPEAGRVVWFYT